MNAPNLGVDLTMSACFLDQFQWTH